MAQQNIKETFRFGLRALIGAILAPGVTADRPLNPETGLTRVNTTNNSIEYAINGKWFSTEISARLISETRTNNFTAESGNLYPVTPETITSIKLPSNPKIGEKIILLDNDGTLSAFPITITKNGSKINGIPSDYLLKRNFDLITFTYEGEVYGWSVLHTQPPQVDVQERYQGFVDINNTINRILTINNVTRVNLPVNSMIDLFLPETAVMGSEIIVKLVGQSGMSVNPTATIKPTVGSTLDEIVDKSYALTSPGSWVKFKYLDGWTIDCQSDGNSTLVGFNLNDPVLRVAGNYYLTNTIGNLPPQVPPGSTCLVEVDEGRKYTSEGKKTDFVQNLFVPTLSRTWVRKNLTVWTQDTVPYKVEFISDAQSAEVNSNSDISIKIAGNFTVDVKGTPIDGDRLSISSNVVGATHTINLNATLNSTTSSTLNISVTKMITLIYSQHLNTWVVFSDSNAGNASFSPVNGVLYNAGLGREVMIGNFIFTNATGKLPPYVEEGNNVLLIENKNLSHYAVNPGDLATWGLSTVIDTNTNDVWTRNFNKFGWLGHWRKGSGGTITDIDDTTIDTVIPFETHSTNTVIDFRSTTGKEFDFTDTDLRVGDKILIMHRTDAVITLSNCIVVNSDNTLGEAPNILSGPGTASFVVDSRKRLAVISANKN